MKSLRKTRYYRIILWAGLLISAILLWQLSGQILSTTKAVSSEDHWRFWTAWRLTLRGENPYDARNLARFREELPWLKEQPAFLPVILNPPWAIVLVTPFGPFSYPVSRMLWLLASIGMVLACSNLTWRLYGGRKELLWAAWLAAFTFFPTILMLKQGQINPWMLLGLCGFLYWTSRRRNDWWAGISLALCTVKPQVLLVLWAAVLVWVIRERRWKVLLGGGAAIAAASLAVTIANPAIWSQFLTTYLADTPVEWMTPTVGFYLRLWLGVEKFWLQFIPPALGLAWLAWYLHGRRGAWEWLEMLPPVLWACILTSPYSWTYDQVVLLIPVLAATSTLLWDGWTRQAWKWMGAYWLINLAAFGLHRYFTDEYFIWLAPCLLLWYWFAQHSISRYQYREG